MSEDVGRLIAGRYRLTEQIGRGGMGTVWRAEDEVLGRQVALKRLHIQPHLSPDDLTRLYERTRREARSAARIAHPNVVVVHDVVDDHQDVMDGIGAGVRGAGGDGEGQPCIVMEFVPAPTLADVLEGGRTIAPEEAARIGLGMVAALRAAHAAGVLHRDVKPGNVLLAGEGRVVLTDFGIAMTADASTLTKTGEMVGSIHYMAPERIRGQKPGPASDLWALGATLYQAVEGRPPFRRLTAMEAAYAIAVDPLEPLKQGGALEPLIEALLAKDPADRPSAEDTERALRAVVSGSTTEALPRPAATGHASAPGTAGGNPSGASGTGGGRVFGSWTDGDRTDGGRIGGDGIVGDRADRDRADRATDRGATQETRRGVAPAAPETRQGGIPAAQGQPGDSATLSHRRRGKSRSRGRRRSRVLVPVAIAVTVAAALVGAALYSTVGTDGDPTKEQAATPSYSPSPVPDGFRLVTEKGLGVSFPVPDDWTLKTRTSEQVTYIDPTGLAQISIGIVDPAGTHPLAHFKDIEANTKVNYPGTYRKLRMVRTTFRGQPAAIWEFTFEGRARAFRAIDLGYGQEGEREYDIYLSAPDSGWDTYRPVFDKVRDGFLTDGS
ncbi:serine/threonine-protein kinase [Streptomyces sp. NPDC002643]